MNGTTPLSQSVAIIPFTVGYLYTKGLGRSIADSELTIAQRVACAASIAFVAIAETLRNLICLPLNAGIWMINKVGNRTAKPPAPTSIYQIKFPPNRTRVDEPEFKKPQVTKPTTKKREIFTAPSGMTIEDITDEMEAKPIPPSRRVKAPKISEPDDGKPIPPPFIAKKAMYRWEFR
jgi:hypothetical protein